MSQPATYVIETPIDFLKVPVDRLPDCLRDFRSFLAAYIAIGIATEGLAAPSDTSFTWIDDGLGVMRVKLHSGGEVFKEFTLSAPGDSP